MIRPANQSEGDALTDLALRAKAHWGYDAAFIEDCRAELTITPEYIQRFTVRVSAQEGRPVAFYSLEPRDNQVELAHLFVEPDLIGGGLGKLLWQDAIATARSLGFGELLITSDPYAEGFYLAMGAARIGVVKSEVRAGRELPLLRVYL